MLMGGCRCGAVRYRIDADAVPPTYACHCTRCQTTSGSAFTVQMPVGLDRVTVEEVRDAGVRMLAGPRALASVGAKLALAA